MRRKPGTLERIEMTNSNKNEEIKDTKANPVQDFVMPFGTPTGLCDSKGFEIKVGDKIKKPTDCNRIFHGRWCIYTVELQGIVPVLRYFISEKGQKIPVGYTGGPLSDEYDQKNFTFATDSKSLRPNNDLEVYEV